MDRTQVPLLRTPLEVADYRTDSTHTWADLAAAHDLLRARIGVREGDRLWRLGGQVVDHRQNRPACAYGWCGGCGGSFTLIDRDRSVPAHIHPDRYDVRCEGSGTVGLTYDPNGVA